MTIEELNTKIDKIDNEISELEIKRHYLNGQKTKEVQKEAQKHIGRCFKINGKQYVKVIGVPEEDFDHMLNPYFDEHLFHAIFLADVEGCDVPFVYDLLHSEAWGDGCESYDTYEEISQDEFNAEFKRVLNDFKSRVLTKGDKTCLTCRMYDNPTDFLCTSCTNGYSNYEPVEEDAE